MVDVELDTVLLSLSLVPETLAIGILFSPGAIALGPFLSPDPVSLLLFLEFCELNSILLVLNPLPLGKISSPALFLVLAHLLIAFTLLDSVFADLIKNRLHATSSDSVNLRLVHVLTTTNVNLAGSKGALFGVGSGLGASLLFPLLLNGRRNFASIEQDSLVNLVKTGLDQPFGGSHEIVAILLSLLSVNIANLIAEFAHLTSDSRC